VFKYDLTTFRTGVKSNNRIREVSIKQAADRAGVSKAEWERWENDIESQPDNIDEILLAVVLNWRPPEPFFRHKAEIDAARVKAWRKDNPERYREYMREYMKRRRQKAKQK
jgi:transcriptional regulator with XRE-family HTH domain